MGAFDVLGLDYGLEGQDELLGDDELLLGLDELDAVLGARGRRRGGGGGGRMAIARKIGYRKALAAGAASGTPPSGAKEWPLGFPVLTFTSATGTLLNAVTRPQRLHRGRRLSITVIRSAGAAAVAVSVNQIFIGADNQMIAAQPIPAETFGPTAVGTSMVFTPASPGIDVTIQYLTNIVVPVGESVVVQTSLIGDSWGS
jgi:hypothetical protein